MLGQLLSSSFNSLTIHLFISIIINIVP